MSPVFTRARAPLALALAAAALGGCEIDDIGLNCNDIHVADLFILDLDDAPAAGEQWVLDVVADGEPGCTLVFDGDEASAGVWIDADGCSHGRALLGPADGGLLIHLPDFTPGHVAISLTIDDAPAGAVDVEPDYATEDHTAACQIALETTIALDVQRPE